MCSSDYRFTFEKVSFHLVVHAGITLAPCRPRQDFQVNQKGFAFADYVLCRNAPNVKVVKHGVVALCKTVILYVRHSSLICDRSNRNRCMFPYRADYIITHGIIRLGSPRFQSLDCTSFRNSRYAFPILGLVRYCPHLCAFGVSPSSRGIFYLVFPSSRSIS